MNKPVVPLSDEKALKKLIEHYEFFVQNEPVGLMDINFVPLTVSDYTLKVLNKYFDLTREQLLSRSWFDQETIQLSNAFPDPRLMAINKAKKTLEPMAWLYINPRLVDTEFWAAITKVIPLVNPPTGNLLCFEFSNRPIKNINSLSKLLFKRELNFKLLSGPIACGLLHNSHHLTDLEHEILFMFSHLFTVQEMQLKLLEIYQSNFNDSKLVEMLQNLAQKLHLDDIEQLKNFAQKNGYINQIPKKLLTESLVDVPIDLSFLLA